MDRPLFHRVYDAGHLIEEVAFCEPEALFASLASLPFALFLDSATAGPDKDPSLHGRWSHIAIDPFLTLTKKDGVVRRNREPVSAGAFDTLAAELERVRLAADWAEEDGLPPFTGGFAGFLGYELGRELETLPARKPWGEGTPPPDMALGAYDCVLAFDHIAKRAFIVSTGLPETTPAARAVRAEARAARWRARLALNPALPPLHWPDQATPASAVTAGVDRETYEGLVQRTVDYIHAGDVFQANLSQRFAARLQNGDDPFTLYRRLRTLSPAPFAGFFNFGGGALLSSSPERFLASDGRQVETRPIKGTRPRGRTTREDAALARDLAASEKDRAENVMIVDLLRNDLSRVCEDGSVRVPALCELQSFANVHHLVSRVDGTLAPGKTSVDLLRACFPGGSITGAPKVRAMEIIAELEDRPRGPYCGSLGYLGFDGAMDTNISIRSMVIMEGRVTFRSGGGIVADSNPSAEYEETLAKASGLKKAILGEKPAGTQDEEKARA